MTSLNAIKTKLPSLNPNSMQSWNIAYDEYTDNLQIYKPGVFEITKDEIKIYREGDFRLDLNGTNNEVVLIEIKNVYHKTKKRINKIDKNAIIDFVVHAFNKEFKYG